MRIEIAIGLLVLFMVRIGGIQTTRQQQFSIPSCVGSSQAIISNACLYARYISLGQQDAFPSLMRLSQAVAGGKAATSQSEYHLNGIPSLQLNTALGNAVPLGVNDLGIGTSTAISQFYKNSNSSLNNVSRMVTGVESAFASTEKFLNDSAQSWLSGMYTNDVNSLNTLIKIANTLNGNSSSNPIFGGVSRQLNSAPTSLSADASYISDLSGNLSDLGTAVTQNETLLNTEFGDNIAALETKMDSFMKNASSDLENSTTASVTNMLTNVTNQFTAAGTNMNNTISNDWGNWNVTFAQMLTSSANAMRLIAQQTTLINTSISNVSSDSNAQLAAQGSAPALGMIAAYDILNNQTYNLSNLVKGVYSPEANSWGINADGTVSNLTSMLGNAASAIQRALMNGSNNSLAQTLLASMSKVGSLQQSINDAQAKRIQQNMGLISNLTNQLRSSGESFQSLMGNLNQIQTAMNSQFDSNSTNSSSDTENHFTSLLNSIQSRLQTVASGTSVGVSSANENLGSTQSEITNLVNEFKAALAGNASNVSALLDQLASESIGAASTELKSLENLETNAKNQEGMASAGSVESKKQDSRLEGMLFGLGQNVSALASKTSAIVQNKQEALMPSFQAAQSGLSKTLANFVNQISIQAAPASSLTESVANFRSRYNETAAAGISSLQQSLDSILPLTRAWQNHAKTLYNSQAVLVSKNSSSVANISSAILKLVSAADSEIDTFETAPMRIDTSQREIKRILSSPVLDAGTTLTSASKLNGSIVTQNTSLSQIGNDLSILNRSLHARIDSFQETTSNKVASILNLLGTAKHMQALLNQETNVLHTDIAKSAAADNLTLIDDEFAFNNVINQMLIDSLEFRKGPLIQLGNWVNSTENEIISKFNGSAALLFSFPTIDQVNASLSSSHANASMAMSKLTSILEANAISVLAAGSDGIAAINNSLLVTAKRLAQQNTTSPNIAVLQSLLQNVSQTVSRVSQNATDKLLGLAQSATSNLSARSDSDGNNLSNMNGAINDALQAANGLIGDDARLTSNIKSELAAQMALRQNSASIIQSRMASSAAQMDYLLGKAIKTAVSSDSNISASANSSSLSALVVPSLQLWNKYTEQQLPFIQKTISESDRNLEFAETALPSSLKVNQDIYVKGASSLRGVMSDLQRMQFDLDDRILSANYSVGSVQEPFETPINGTNVSTLEIFGLNISPSKLRAEQRDQDSSMTEIQTDVDNMLRGAI